MFNINPYESGAQVTLNNTCQSYECCKLRKDHAKLLVKFKALEKENIRLIQKESELTQLISACQPLLNCISKITNENNVAQDIIDILAVQNDSNSTSSSSLSSFITPQSINVGNINTLTTMTPNCNINGNIDNYTSAKNSNHINCNENENCNELTKKFGNDDHDENYNYNYNYSCNYNDHKNDQDEMPGESLMDGQNQVKHNNDMIDHDDNYNKQQLQVESINDHVATIATGGGNNERSSGINVMSGQLSPFAAEFTVANGNVNINNINNINNVNSEYNINIPVFEPTNAANAIADSGISGMVQNEILISQVGDIGADPNSNNNNHNDNIINNNNNDNNNNNGNKGNNQWGLERPITAQDFVNAQNGQLLLGSLMTGSNVNFGHQILPVNDLKIYQILENWHRLAIDSAECNNLLILGEMDFSLALSVSGLLKTAGGDLRSKNLIATSYHTSVNKQTIENIVKQKSIAINLNSNINMNMTNMTNMTNMNNMKNTNMNTNLTSSKINCKLKVFNKKQEIIESKSSNVVNQIHENISNLLMNHWNVYMGVDAKELFENYKDDITSEYVKYDKIFFGFPREYYNSPSQRNMNNQTLIKDVLKQCKTILSSNIGEFHMLLNVSIDKRTNRKIKQFDSWLVMDNGNNEWDIKLRLELNFQQLKTIFKQYIPRGENGKVWEPIQLEYIVLKLKKSNYTSNGAMLSANSTSFEM